MVRVGFSRMAGVRSLVVVLLLAGMARSAGAANTAVVPVAKEREGWIKRNQAMHDELAKGNAKLLWIGDSIVEKWESSGHRVWKKYYAHRDAVNLGIGGDRTEHVLWRLDHYDLSRIDPKLAIVMIGQNNGGDNTAEEIAEGVTAIVSRLREKLPAMQILLLGIFFRGEHPNDEQTKLAKTNEIIAKLADGQHVSYLNVNDIFLAPNGDIRKELMPDFEHPNEAGCRVWAEAIEPSVAKLLGGSPVAP